MTTQVVVGGGLIPYRPDIIDQYILKSRTPLATIAVGIHRARKTILPV